MEQALAILDGFFFAAGIFMLLSNSLIRVLIGIAILGNAVNLLIFTAGRLVREVPPIIPRGAEIPPALIANPLPQALILTAIVISFSLFAFMLVLVFRSYQALGSDATDRIGDAEPRDGVKPPVGY